ncbi:hypothetical protein [Streptomyces sp. NPDC056464]|uniref:hypothetical protein n=1 Tax=Streptomyces sp. NPDC056464 TaxID=3345828 RepID=UPI0036A13600
MPRDQRLVQTTVIDSAESEIPALLPMQADQARAFRQPAWLPGTRLEPGLFG